jgi:hypothetical protein
MLLSMASPASGRFAKVHEFCTKQPVKAIFAVFDGERGAPGLSDPKSNVNISGRYRFCQQIRPVFGTYNPLLDPL